MATMNVLVSLALSAAVFAFQATPEPHLEMRARINKIVVAAEPGWILQTNTNRPPVQPGYGDIYEWRHADGRRKLNILIRHYPDAGAARDYVQHLMPSGPIKAVDGIGDIAVIGYGGDPVVHFAVDEMYVQLLSSGSEESAVRLARRIAEDLRREHLTAGGGGVLIAVGTPSHVRLRRC